MNRIFYQLMLLCLVIASCDDERNEEKLDVNTPKKEYSHLAFFGLKGPVSRVVETSYSLAEGSEGEEENQLFDMGFNSVGQMTHYYPTGTEPQARGVWQTVAGYSYRYDEKGRMIQVVVTPLGDEPVVYTLQYGDHSVYVPLIFPLGVIDFFPVKGLQSITSEDGSVSYQFDGEKAAYEEETWNGIVKTEYRYESGASYPAKKVVTTSREGVILNEQTTMYAYDAEGRLLMQDIKIKEEGAEVARTIIRYVEGQLLLPVTKKMDMGTIRFDWTYRYDAKNCLQQVQYTENGGTEEEIADKEEYTYLSFDDYGNWTDSRQLQSSLVDWSHADGLIGVCRKITY